MKWRELFPTNLAVLIFVLYLSLFLCHGIFVTVSQDSSNSYSYNTVTVVLLTEFLKLLISVAVYYRENNFKSLISAARQYSNVMLLYFVPAFLYCLYNNLAFVNLSTFDPTTYYLLLQLRVVVTGVLFQIIFKKYLTRRQWLSLLLLTIGCMLKEVNFNKLLSITKYDDNETAITQFTNKTTLTPKETLVDSTSKLSGKNMTGFDFSISALYILAQVMSSCLASVYTEYLVKDKGPQVNIFVQNIFMYVDSIVCNVVILLIRGELFDAFTAVSLREIVHFNVIIIIVSSAAAGIVTSFFLKYMNSILKTFANVVELLLSAVVCYFLFAIPVYINTALAIAVVSGAIYLYSQSPVLNLGKEVPLTNVVEATQTAQDKPPGADEYIEMVNLSSKC